MTLLGVLFVALSSMLYGVQPTVRQLIVTQDGATPAQVQLISSAFTLLYMLLYCAARRRSLRIGLRPALLLVFIGAVGSGLCSLLLVLSYQYMPVGMSTVIHFLYPTIVCLASAVLYRTRLRAAHVLGVALSLAGLTLVGWGAAGTTFTGVVLSALSGVTFAFYVLAMERSGAGRLDPFVRMVYVAGGWIAVSLAGVAVLGGSIPLEAGTVAALGADAMITAGAALLLLLGLSRIGSTMTAFLSLLEPVTSVTLSAVVFRDDVTPATLAGCAAILAAIVCASLGDRQNRLPQPEKPGAAGTADGCASQADGTGKEESRAAQEKSGEAGAQDGMARAQEEGGAAAGR